MAPSQPAPPPPPPSFQPPVPAPQQYRAPPAPAPMSFPPVTHNAPPPPPPAVAPPAAAPSLLPGLSEASKLQGLFSALIKAGVVSDSKNGTPTGAGFSSQMDIVAAPASDVAQARDASRAYRQAVLSHKVKLTSADIMRYAYQPPGDMNFRLTILRQRPVMTKLLHDRLPAQCKQCGLRFPDGEAGKKEMYEHLDMHFRQNSKASQNAGRGHSRSWFISIEVSTNTYFYLRSTDPLPLAVGLAS